jgi:exodeoxyribonuclease I
MQPTFFWYDYETWGTDPARDRVSQFAGLRTDWELNPVGQPLTLYCRPADDMLPQPAACLITGITPQKALAEGLCEAEFFGHIHTEMARPNTCTAGFNSLRFDDEFTRYGLYRNFFDPYAREWRYGNSRWDLIDVVRLTHALRPEGIEWPKGEDGATSFRLERLTEANDIPHVGAHDALADVRATIAVARLIRERQRRLFDYALQLREKRKAAELLDLKAMQPVLHVSSKFPAAQGCISPVVPLARHPGNNNGIIVYDLRVDPSPLLGLPVEEVHRRLFTPRDALGEGVERIPLKTVHLNKSPMLAPLTTLSPQMAERWSIDLDGMARHLEALRRAPGLAEKIQAVHNRGEFPPLSDPDLNLYGGGFFSDADRKRMDAIRHTKPEALGAVSAGVR